MNAIAPSVRLHFNPSTQYLNIIIKPKFSEVDMVRQRLQKSSERSSQPQESAMAPVLTQRRSPSPHTQQDTNSQVIPQHNREAAVLKIQAKYGTITPQGQERLTFLQAKMADETQRKLNFGDRLHQNISNSSGGDVSVASPERKTALQQGAMPIHRQVQQKSPEQHIQRTIYLGDNKQKLERESLKANKLKQGKGNRNIGAMMQDRQRDFFFKDSAEMENYASGRTETIGYLDKNNIWIRIPDNRLLVLGEFHSMTVLPDIVKAVGTKRYIYEPYTEYPKDLLNKSKKLKETRDERAKEFNKKSGQKDDEIYSHDAEKSLPKIVISLLSLRQEVEQIIHQQSTVSQSVDIAQTNYNRQKALLYWLHVGILMAAKVAKYRKDVPDLWKKHQEIFKTTVKENQQKKEIKDTDFIKSIRKGEFTYDEFVQSFKTEADTELRESGNEQDFENFHTHNEDRQAGKVAATDEQARKKYERMREFYMVEKMERAKNDGYLLAGIGFTHQLHIEEILKSKSGIEAKSMDNFITEQQEKHKPS